MNIPPEEIARERADGQNEKSSTTIGVVVTFGFIALFFVLARVLFRVKSKNNFVGLDDYLLIIGMLSTSILIMASSVQSWFAIGRHIVNITPGDIIINGKWQLVSAYSYLFALVFVKLSILALLVRVFKWDKRWFRWGVHATAIYLSLWFIAMLLTVSLICRPISTWWSVTRNCGPSFLTGWVSGIFNVISDVILIALPQPLLWGSQMSMRKKTAVSAIFLTGFIATVISVIRIPFLQGTFLGNPQDATYNGYYAIIFTCLEPTLGIICACMPAMPHVFRTVATNVSSVLSSRQQLVSKDGLPRSVQTGSQRRHSENSMDTSQESSAGTGRGFRNVYKDGAPQPRDSKQTQYELSNLQPSQE